MKGLYAQISVDALDGPKFLELSDSAWAMWGKGNLYCQRHKTDGRIPAAAIASLSKAKKPKDVAAELVRARLWEEADGAYQVHDYLDHNRSAAEIDAIAESRRSAGKRGGVRSGEARSKDEALASEIRSACFEFASTNDEAKRTQIQTQTQIQIPDGEAASLDGPPAAALSAPTTDPRQVVIPGTCEGGIALAPPSVPPKAKSAKAKHQRPEDWRPSAAHYATGKELGLSGAAVDAEARKFRDFHDAKGTVFADWDAGFRTWLGNVPKFQGGGGGRPPAPESMPMPYHRAFPREPEGPRGVPMPEETRAALKGLVL